MEAQSLTETYSLLSRTLDLAGSVGCSWDSPILRAMVE